MRYKLFGTSGLRVSELCLGTMIFGDTRAVGATQEESRQLFEAFVDAGGNFIDTARLSCAQPWGAPFKDISRARASRKS